MFFLILAKITFFANHHSTLYQKFKIFKLNLHISFRYVQDLISREKSLLKKFIMERGGYFYVSGSSKNMPAAVKEALEEALDDKEYVANMIKCDRYQEETWA